jgi:hypothetical protein
MSDRMQTVLRHCDVYLPSDEEVLEVPLLLSGWQVRALEQAAHQRGLTAGEMVRSLLDEFFTDREEEAFAN